MLCCVHSEAVNESDAFDAEPVEGAGGGEEDDEDDEEEVAIGW
jgi:hypothetical protein